MTDALAFLIAAHTTHAAHSQLAVIARHLDPDPRAAYRRQRQAAFDALGLPRGMVA